MQEFMNHPTDEPSLIMEQEDEDLNFSMLSILISNIQKLNWLISYSRDNNQTFILVNNF